MENKEIKIIIEILIYSENDEKFKENFVKIIEHYKDKLIKIKIMSVFNLYQLINQAIKSNLINKNNFDELLKLIKLIAEIIPNNNKNLG